MKTEYVVSIDDRKIKIKDINDSTLLLNNKKLAFDLIQIGSNKYNLIINQKVYEILSEKKENGEMNLLIDGYHVETTIRTALQEKAAKLLEAAQSKVHHHLEVNSPMPGIILKIKKHHGETVNKGESVLILEAMKMENEIKSPASGKIIRMDAEEGRAVLKNSFLFSIE